MFYLHQSEHRALYPFQTPNVVLDNQNHLSEKLILLKHKKVYRPDIKGKFVGHNNTRIIRIYMPSIMIIP